MIKSEIVINEFGLKNSNYKIANKKYYKELYRKIKKNKPIDLSLTYFDGFSLADYRKKYNIDDSMTIKVYIDNAMFAIFDGRDNEIDFSNIEFIASDKIGGISFDNSVFLGGTVNFSYSSFDNTDLSFDDCQFYNCKLRLVYCDKIKDLTFINSKKQNSDFIIFGVSINNGDLDFSNMNSNLKSNLEGGNIFIEDCKLTNAKIIFNNNNFEAKNMHDLLFINNKFQLNKIEISSSYFSKIVFYKCSFDNETIIDDCTFDYFILQDCVLRDVFKYIIYKASKPKSSTKFCFLNTISNGYFNIENNTDKHFLRSRCLLNKQKRFCINYDVDYECEEKSRFYLDDTTYLEKSMQANNLSEIFYANGMYKEQDDVYSLSRRYRNLYRIQDIILYIKGVRNDSDLNNLKKIYYYLIYFFKLLFSTIVFSAEFILMDFLCGNYATKPLKFFVRLIEIIVGFGIIFMLCFDLDAVNYIVNLPKNYNQFMLPFLISFSNFFQLEFIENFQNHIMYIVSSFEKVLGFIILAIFTVSYTRKVIK